jgi:hypothetical protein
MPAESGMRGGAAPGGTAGGKSEWHGRVGSRWRQGRKCAEDGQHQGKILLSENDPDSIFGGFDGGQKPTPPVIGA